MSFSSSSNLSENRFWFSRILSIGAGIPGIGIWIEATLTGMKAATSAAAGGARLGVIISIFWFLSERSDFFSCVAAIANSVSTSSVMGDRQAHFGHVDNTPTIKPKTIDFCGPSASASTRLPLDHQKY
jgi:hypothetical protein